MPKSFSKTFLFLVVLDNDRHTKNNGPSKDELFHCRDKISLNFDVIDMILDVLRIKYRSSVRSETGIFRLSKRFQNNEKNMVYLLCECKAALLVCPVFGR